MACKEGQFDVVELMVNDQFNNLSINLNAQHENGMTPFDIRLLDTLSINIKCSCAFLHYNCAVCSNIKKGCGPPWPLMPRRPREHPFSSLRVTLTHSYQLSRKTLEKVGILVMVTSFFRSFRK